MRFRLRYQGNDIGLLDGEYLIGRNSSCQISLDDPLVSRRHALLTVSPGSVVVSDLQSRNGVLVNGSRIGGPTALYSGDQVAIGEQLLVLVDTAVANVAPLPPPLPHFSVPTPGPARASTLPVRSGAHRAPAMPMPLANPGVQSLTIVGPLAERSLELGQAREAERLLASPLADVVEASRMRAPLSPIVVEQAALLSAKLARATGKGAWADYVVELYEAQLKPCSNAVLDELERAVYVITTVDLHRFARYVEQLFGRSSQFSEDELVRLQRVDELYRLASARR